MSKTETPPLIIPLVAQILEQSSRDLAWTTNTLIDNLTAERDELQAELEAIRHGASTLLRGQWMPTPDALLSALWPSGETIDHYRKGGVS